ncbi:MAG: TVP38/TMEM64 family protein [Candidatus Eremiobacteraeota bacterium]|nr:TVP38/TMEM64 family protein [Candidatus Eremiobacteraeota bacterium]
MSNFARRLTAIAILIVSFSLAALVIRHQPAVEKYIRTIGPLAYPIAIGFFTVVASAPFSVTDALAIMNGSVFGPLWGSVVNAIGLVFAALLGYYLNRRASHLLDLESTLERLPPWIRRFRIGSAPFLLSVRLIPGLGGTLATSVAATFRVPIIRHVWTMCAIAIPICTLLAIFGDQVTAVVHKYEYRVHQRVHEFYERHRPRFFHRVHKP